MPRSFSIVDYKVSQAEFFLRKLQEAELDFFAAQCFTDAFASAARSITFALQSVCNDIPEFSKWYLAKQEILKADSLAQFFNRYRTASIHIGDTVVRGGTNYRAQNGKRCTTYFFIETPDIPNPPADDVYTACEKHFANILGIVLEAYQLFASQIDDRWYFTADNFQKLGKSIGDALAELGFPNGWPLLHSCSALFSSKVKYRLLILQLQRCQPFGFLEKGQLSKPRNMLNTRKRKLALVLFVYFAWFAVFKTYFPARIGWERPSVRGKVRT